ncbi:TetR family transcriptional regulator [Variovorax sp. J22G73]|uniref:TetR/AcrR family transcriptional regulator n=1 Tax=unclassified Variovorax TaxID=663243 RepID=UPI002577647F|nr:MULTISPECIES: TetR/AcrR family transcriptional regulator [unclassified Variovorax]MDM0004992.1 TetR family transcriptional regulator [Variovorax sp. J22R203]MDM0098408.1 TetR family transcriptional regulator [Variovorax sp. J22G73]
MPEKLDQEDMTEAVPKSTEAVASRNATETRGRILEAARACFSRRSYENVGVREIGRAAGVDAALVNRYFGNKEMLFAEVVQGAFRVEEHLPESLDTLGEFLVKGVMAEGSANDEGSTDDGFNALRLLILAAASPETAATVSAQFHAEFVAPLAKKLRGRDAELRAALIGSYVIGLATMRHLLDSPTLADASQRKLAALAGEAIQACVQARA